MITITCDSVDEHFRRCNSTLSGLAFNAKPEGWKIVPMENGDHFDYCPEHDYE